MLKPSGDWMIVVKSKDVSNIVMPDSVQGDTFIVQAMGEGLMLDNGLYYRPIMNIGDKVWLEGKMLNLPYKNGKVLLARMSQVLLIEPTEKLEIPEAI